MSKKTGMRIQTLILLLLLPALLLITVSTAKIVYSGLYDDIIDGFDRKLMSVSTVTASFLQGEDQEELLESPDIRALVFDPESRTLFAAEYASGILYTVDVESGQARKIGATGLSAISDLAYDPGSRLLYGLSNSSIVRLDPVSSTSLSVGTCPDCTGLAWNPSRRRLMAANSGLIELDPQTGRRTKLIPALSQKLTALAVDETSNRLLAMDPANGELVELDLKTYQTRSTALREPDSQEEQPDGSAPAATDAEGPSIHPLGLAFDAAEGTLYGATDRLVEIDTERSTADAFGYPGFRSEDLPLYRRYVEPMQRIKQRANLSYLYSFVLRNNDRDIVYVLDASQNDDHSRIGDVDSDPAEEGTRKVFREGGVNLSPIEYWEQWGLIKSADAPVFDRNGAIRAVAGADVNISIIEKKTRAALAKVSLVGALSLLVAVLAALKITNRLVQPIDHLKEEALKIAAGQFGREVQVQSPAELRELALSFNNMSQALQTTLDELNHTSRQLEDGRRSRELTETLARLSDRIVPSRPEILSIGRFPSQGRRDSSGWVCNQDHLLCWIVDKSPAEPAEAIQLRSEIAVIAGRVLQKYAKDREKIFSVLQSLSLDSVSAFLLFEASQGKVEALARTPMSLLVVAENGEVAAVELRKTSLTLGSSEHVVLASSADLLDRLKESIPQRMRKEALQGCDAGELLSRYQRNPGNGPPHAVDAEADKLIIVMKRET